jgi:hypothetical protein
VNENGGRSGMVAVRRAIAEVRPRLPRSKAIALPHTFVMAGIARATRTLKRTTCALRITNARHILGVRMWAR